MGKHDMKAYKKKSTERRPASFNNTGSSVKGALLLINERNIQHKHFKMSKCDLAR